MAVYKVKPTLGGQGGGGVEQVSTLPEVGNEGVIYKTPDGKLWSCVNKETTEIVVDLAVGKSFKFVESISKGDVEHLMGKLSLDVANLYFIEDEQFPILMLGTTSYNTYTIRYEIEESMYAEYSYDHVEHPEGVVDIELEGITEIPTVTITEKFVEDISTELTDCTLNDFVPLFQNSTHEETTIVSTWTEIGGSGSLGPQLQPLGNVVSIMNNVCQEAIVNSKFPYLDSKKLHDFLVANNFDLTKEVGENCKICIMFNGVLTAVTSGAEINPMSQVIELVFYDTYIDILNENSQYTDSMSIDSTVTTIGEALEWLVNNNVNIPLSMQSSVVGGDINTIFGSSEESWALPDFIFMPSFGNIIITDEPIYYETVLTDVYMKYVDAETIDDMIIIKAEPEI